MLSGNGRLHWASTTPQQPCLATNTRARFTLYRQAPTIWTAWTACHLTMSDSRHRQKPIRCLYLSYLIILREPRNGGKIQEIHQLHAQLADS